MTSTAPSLLLRGLDLEKFFKDYENGLFNKVIINKVKLNLRVKDIFVSKTEQDDTSQKFAIKSRGLELTMLSNNHNEFTSGLDSENSENQEKICLRCTRKFKHQKTQIVIDCLVETFLLDGNLIQKVKYFGIGRYCTFNCAFGKLTTDLKSSASNYNVQQAMSLTGEVFFSLYPNEKKIPVAQDPSLLDINGGPLNLSEFFSEEYIYFKIPGIYIYPSKETYLRLKN